MGRKELADQLRELRKSAPEHKSVSSMRLFEISSEIERLKNRTATTPAAASYGKGNSLNQVSSVEDAKEAKRAEFPVKPEGSGKGKVSKGGVKGEKVAVEKPVKEVKKMTTKKSAPGKPSKASLQKMLDEMSDSD